jgi:hypothetical protein
MVWLEVLAALAITALVSLSGMRGIALLLERHQQAAAAQIERAAVERLQSQLQGAWDRRCAHAFQDGAWLRISGLPTEQGLELAALEMRVFGDAGRVEVWRLPAPAIDGSILLTGADAMAGEWPGGRVPRALHFRFPGATDRVARAGFAIRAIW